MMMSGERKEIWVPPVHLNKEDNKWWFWDETWSYKHGPYETEEIANRKCQEYADTL